MWISPASSSHSISKITLAASPTFKAFLSFKEGIQKVSGCSLWHASPFRSCQKSSLKLANSINPHVIHNAALRGECRSNQPSADHFHHQNSPHTKNATRHESLLNALLCLSFNGLRFARTKINSTLIYKQKTKRRKPKWLIVLKIGLWNLATKTQKAKFKYLIKPTALTSRLRENWFRQFSELPAPKNKCPENSAHWNQLADELKVKKLREQRKAINHWFYVIKHNAALRGECRINQASADHFHHQNSLQTKNATRHESRLNALLCTIPINQEAIKNLSY